MFDQSVQLTAAPQNGFAISSWTGCTTVSGDNKCTVVMSSDKTVTANFADAENPGAGLLAPAVGANRRGLVEIVASASDNWGVSRVEFRLDASPLPLGSDSDAPYFYAFDSTTKGDGAHTVEARAVDFAGRLGPWVTRSITIDNTAPEITVGGPDGQTFGPGSTQTWTLSADDQTSGVASLQCSVQPDGSPPSFGPCSGPASHAVTGLAAGDYDFAVRVTDGAGNTTDATRQFTIDATPPDTTIAAGPADGSSSSEGSDTGPGELKPSIARRWKLAGEMTMVKKLVVGKLARGTTVDVRCKGKGCPFRSRRLSAKGSSVALTKLFDSELAPGSSIELRITQAGFVGKVYRFVTRPGKAPRTKVLCLPPGSSKPVAC